MKSKILICYHKKDLLLKNEVLTPIHVGRSVAQLKSKDGKISIKELNWLKTQMIGDDTYDNISNLNRDFSELTAIYWAWKNYEKLGNPDIIGLTHYRRFFNLSNNNYFTFDIAKWAGYTNENLSNLMKDTDIICLSAEKIDSNRFDNFNNDLIHLSKTNHYDLYQSYNEFKKDGKLHFKNMFIMKKAIFFDYCETIFNILLPLSKQIQSSNVSNSNADNLSKKKLACRILGYIAEYLTSFYIEAQKRNGKIVKEYPIIRPDITIKNYPIIYRSRTAHNGNLYLCGKKIFHYSYYKK